MGRAPFDSHATLLSYPLQHARLALIIMVGALLAQSCYTPAELRDRADRDAYALIDARRKQLFDEDSPFSLPSPTQAFGREARSAEDWTVREKVLAGAVTGVGPLNVVGALGIAAENSELVQREQEGLYRAALDLTLEQWRFGYQYDASASGGASGEINGNLGTASKGFSASVTRVLGTGAVILADVGASLFRVVSTGDGWDGITSLGLSITQPLLKGTGELVTLEPLRQSERTLVYAVRAYERFRRTYAVNVSDRVYRVQQSLDQLNNERLNFENLTTLRVRNERLAEAGELSEVQADQARQDELGSENRLVVLQGNTERQLDTFKVFLGLPVECDLFFEEGILRRLGVESDVLNQLRDDVAVEFAIAHRLDVMTSFDRVQDAVRKEAIARDALRAGLSVSAAASEVTAEGKVLQYSFNDAIWSAGVDVDLPIDLLPLRNAWRRAELTLVDTRRRYERSLDDVTVSVRDALRRARNSFKSFKIQEGAVLLSERRVRGAELSLEAGEAITRDLLEAQSSLRSSRDSATAARIAFTLDLLGLWLELELLRVDESGVFVDPDLSEDLRTRTRERATAASDLQ
ncbi:MAG: TolC family protein [Planctomycetota bacterium]|nr:TolC family protein [Planctomycetota bacterium]